MLSNISDAIVWTAWTVQHAEVAEMSTRHESGLSNSLDCRPDFMESFEVTAKLGNVGFGNPKLRLFTPFITIGKHDIVTCGANLPEPDTVPYKYTWSCYRGGEGNLKHMSTGDPIHCGRCGTCVERKEAFRLAKVPDPTVYADPEFKIVAFRG